MVWESSLDSLAVESVRSAKTIEGLLGLEAHFKDGHRLRKPLQVKLALGDEIEELSDTEITYSAGNGDSIGGSDRTEPCGQLHRRAKQVAAFSYRFANADADPKVKLRLSFVISAFQRALNIYAGFNGTRNGGKGRHNAVASVFHLTSAPLVQGGAHNLVVLVKEHHKPLVAQLLCLLGGVT